MYLTATAYQTAQAIQNYQTQRKRIVKKMLACCVSGQGIMLLPKKAQNGR